MTVAVDFWHLVGLLLGFLGFCGVIGNVLLTRTEKHLDERFAALELARAQAQEQVTTRLLGLEQTNRDETVQWQRVEREVLQRFADLPHTYVMRDDYIRGQSILEAKLDGLADKIEKSQLRQALSGRTN